MHARDTGHTLHIGPAGHHRPYGCALATQASRPHGRLRQHTLCVLPIQQPSPHTRWGGCGGCGGPPNGRALCCVGVVLLRLLLVVWQLGLLSWWVQWLTAGV